MKLNTLFLVLLLLAIATVGFAQSTGDYRSKLVTGNWGTYSNWERYNGSVWANATNAQGAPTSASGVVTVRAGSALTIAANVTVDQVIIQGSVNIATTKVLTVANGTGDDLVLNGTGTLTMAAGAGLTVSTSAIVDVYTGTTLDISGGTVSDLGTITITAGTINCGTTAITGTGYFGLLSGGIMKVGANGGVDGNVQTTTKNFNTGANFVFNGTANQVTGASIPNTIHDLTINNGFHTVTLSHSLSVSGTINFVDGLLDLGNFNLFGSGSVTGDVNITYSGSGIASGIGSDIDLFVNEINPFSLPAVVDSLSVQPGVGNNFFLPNDVTTNYLTFVAGGVILNFNNLTLAGKNISFTAPNNTSYINALSVAMTTTMHYPTYINRDWTATGTFGGPVDVTFTWTAADDNSHVWSNSDKPALFLGGVKQISGVYWDNATPREITITTSSFAKKGVWTIGRENGTLPVELSSFTAEVTSQYFVELHWVTQSETGVSGYLVYRNTTEDLASAEVVSPLIQSFNSSSETAYSYTDQEVDPGLYYYWLQNIDMNGEVAYHGPLSILVTNNQGPNVTPDIPMVTDIQKVYPNPFKATTTVVYGLVKNTNVSIAVYNLKGQKVRSLVSESKAAGNWQMTWNGKDDMGRACTAGIYYIKMAAGDASSTQKIMLMR